LGWGYWNAAETVQLTVVARDSFYFFEKYFFFMPNRFTFAADFKLIKLI
jgi:hypothetical protein